MIRLGLTNAFAILLAREERNHSIALFQKEYPFFVFFAVPVAIPSSVFFFLQASASPFFGPATNI